MSSPFDHIRKGALHKWMHVPESEHIPRQELHKIAGTDVGGTYHGQTVTLHRKRQANFALNFGRR